MENTSNVPSEQELLKLREEGKISEQEYTELLGMIRRSPGDKPGRVLPGEPQFQAFRKRMLLGSLVICILGGIIGLILQLPFVCGLSLFGIFAVSIKYHLINKRQKHEVHS